jgi:hypothetical protein
VLRIGIKSLDLAQEPIHYTRCQKHDFGAMDPNIKLTLKMVKLYAEIKEGITG